MDMPKTPNTTLPTKIDRYEIRERIGSGGMGHIFKGFDTKLKRQVAIKMISDRVKDESVRKTIRERFFNEARAAGALSHPHIVQVYDVGEVNEVVYIVMEFIEGETIEQLIKSKGPLNFDNLTKVIKELGSGLAFAHKRGIVHRDIKPSNIIIEANSGVTKILDFGIAKFIDEEEMKLTSTGMVLGSTHYLSPEHITGKNLDRRSDIFCLGTLLYESSTGVLPFRGNNSSTILYKIVHFEPPPAHELRPELSPQISKLISRCMAKKPEDRFQSGEDLISAVQEIERALITKNSAPLSSGVSESDFLSQSWFVRDSQLLTALQTQKKISPEEALQFRGKAVYDLVVRKGSVNEDDLCALIADLLQLPSIPKARLKTLRVAEDIKNFFRSDILQRYHILPFFKDSAQKTVSMVIDGSTDFQREPDIAQAFRDYQFCLYVGSRSSIDRLIQTRILQSPDAESGNLFKDTDEILESTRLSHKRLLLVEPQSNYQQAVISLFQGYESSVTLVSTFEEAIQKIRSEKFHHIWARRDVVGDELAFEAQLLRNNPACDVRFYTNLGEELLEDSIHYLKFREFFIKILHSFLSSGSESERTIANEYASFALRAARAVTQDNKELDEVYFSALLYKWEKLRPQTKRLTEVLQGIFRFRHIIDCIPERYDGRGPAALRAQQIPLASRIMAALLIFEKGQLSFSELKPEQIEAIRAAFDSSSGKQLDPIISSQILDFIAPRSRGTSGKIFLVDSESQGADDMAAHLRRIGMEVHVFEDGMAAVSSAKKSAPDLLITEMMVNKLDGLSIMARLKADATTAKIPIVFFSSSKRPEHSMKALQMGAEDFISKESDPQLVLTKIEKLVKRSKAP
jgi:serine/threonine protein kinase/ActR/RegA family two-component response regulator